MPHCAKSPNRPSSDASLSNYQTQSSLLIRIAALFAMTYKENDMAPGMNGDPTVKLVKAIRYHGNKDIRLV